MAAKRTDANALAEAMRLVKQYGSARAAAAAIGMPHQTFQWRVNNAKKAGIGADSVSESEIEYPDLPSSELPAEELIDQACKRFATHMAASDAQRWFEIKVKSIKPIGVVFMGDPHVDDHGCNWPLLRDHIRILEDTPGLYAIGGNDLTNNWVGRLVRLYADQEISKKQAWKLAKWLLRETRVKWLCHILGNHDQWNDGPYLIKAAAQPIVPVLDWQARFQLVFPNDKRIRIHMAHDFPGHSMWNNLHGAKKQAVFGEDVDILACAHKHSWSIAQEENPLRGNIYHLIRSRGYKYLDQYSDQLGFGSQRYGASVTAVIDPRADGPQRINCFAELEEAAEFLTWKRSRN